MRLGETPIVTQQEGSRARIQPGLCLCPTAGAVSFSTAPPCPLTPAMAGGSVLPSTCTWNLLIKLALKSMHQAQD